MQINCNGNKIKYYLLELIINSFPFSAILSSSIFLLSAQRNKYLAKQRLKIGEKKIQNSIIPIHSANYVTIFEQTSLKLTSFSVSDDATFFILRYN